jgi:hypothetical protein
VQFATAVLKFFKSIIMKHLSRDEMKKVFGGDAPGGGGCAGQGYTHANVICNDNAVIPSANWCANSSNVCNAHGGFQMCVCY